MNIVITVITVGQRGSLKQQIDGAWHGSTSDIRLAGMHCLWQLEVAD